MPDLRMTDLISSCSSYISLVVALSIRRAHTQHLQMPKASTDCMEVSVVDPDWTPEYGIPRAIDWDGAVTYHTSEQIANERPVVYSAFGGGGSVRKYIFESYFPDVGGFQLFKYIHCKSKHAILCRFISPDLVLQLSIQHSNAYMGSMKAICGTTLSGRQVVAQIYKCHEFVSCSLVKKAFKKHLIESNLMTRHNDIKLIKGNQVLNGNVVILFGMATQKRMRAPKRVNQSNNKSQKRIEDFFENGRK